MAPPDSRDQHVASKEEEKAAAKIKEALRVLEPLHARTSELLVASGPRSVMGDVEQRCLAFMDMELSNIIASLKFRLPPLQGHYADGCMWNKWLQGLNLDIVPCTNRLLRLAEPRSHTQLQRAAQYCRRRKSRWSWKEMASFSQMVENPCRYWHNRLLPAATSDLVGLPPQAAEAGGVPLLVGIDRPIKNLLRWLTPQNETDRRLKVICIVGPVGIGKTTLAMEIHNQLRCQTSRAHYYQDFQYNVMVRASRGSDSNQLLLQDILSKISMTSRDVLSVSSHNNKSAGSLVSKRLRDKRYFICINDMREASDWAKIKSAFPDNNLGSRILITTRTESVARSCCSDSEGLMHKVKPLNQADSEMLLLTRASGSLDAVLPKNLKLLVDEILMRSEGVPLFITGMADLLKEQVENQQHQRQEETEEQHQKISIYNEEPAPQLPKQLKQVLSSFYDGLPCELKILYLYMGMFPYGYKLHNKDHVTEKWIFEGIIPNVQFFTYYASKCHAEDYFAQLVESNVITRRVDANSKIIPDQWHVNYFFQQFAVCKCAEMGFLFTGATLKLAAAPETYHDKETKIPRRLALHHPDPELPSLLNTLDLSWTRSLALSGAVSGIPLDKFANLVVLDLEGWENLTDKVLQQVCTSKMFFLQYLSIGNTQVRNLPHEIKLLYSLRVLDISFTQISELPLEVFELELLFALDLRGTPIRQLPKQIVGLMRTLSALSLGGERMINSTTTATALPDNVRHLRIRKLEILATVDLSEEPASFIIALGDLKWLRELAITWSFHQCIDKAYNDALISSIEKWWCLQSLTILCGLGCSIEFLSSLSHPPKYLKKFKVTAGRFANVPKWISELNVLSSVEITVCKQETEDMKILGGLPKLQCLILGLNFIPTKEVAIETEWFPELQRFSVDCPMPWLIFRTGAMGKLTYLQLKFCAIPARQPGVPSGISNLRWLAEVDLCYNEHYDKSPSVNMTVDEVKKQVAKHHNLIGLFINGTEEDYDVPEFDELAENAVSTQSGTEAGTEDEVHAADEKNAATKKIQSTSEIEEIQSDA